MMVHDPDVLPGFKTPWDGEISIAICTSPETVDTMGLETLQAYLGFYAWKVNGLAPLSLTFPASGNGQVGRGIQVREFWNMQHTGTRVETLSEGGVLVLEPGQGSSLGTATMWLLAFGCSGIGALLLLLYLRDRRDSHTAADRS